MVSLDEITMEDALPMLAPLASGKADTFMGALTLEEIVAGVQAFRVSIDGKEMGAIAARIQEASGGDVFWLSGGVSNGAGRDMVRDVLPAVERMAKGNGCRFSAIHTKRRGLVKKLKEAGYEITGITLRKCIEHAPTF